jgi:proline dehydrogenase
MLEDVPKAVFSILGESILLKRLAARYGMRQADGFARRFVAGETLAQAIGVARHIEASGLAITLDYLGEPATSTEAATSATQDYLAILPEVEAAGIGRNLSVKLTQLGIDVDRATSVDNLRRVLEGASNAGFFVRLDMEKSTYTSRTLDAFETLWHIGYQRAGIAIQACLRRSAADIERLNAMGVSVRLVKGEYSEPRDVAFQNKAEVDASFVSLMQALLEKGTRPAIATHDPNMIAETIRFAAANGIPKDHYEFEMLYGIRLDLQASLPLQGHPVRVYVPFGQQWFPYFMRRLGERPSNVGFVVKSLLREKGHGSKGERVKG